MNSRSTRVAEVVSLFIALRLHLYAFSFAQALHIFVKTLQSCFKRVRMSPQYDFQSVIKDALNRAFARTTMEHVSLHRINGGRKIFSGLVQNSKNFAPYDLNTLKSDALQSVEIIGPKFWMCTSRCLISSPKAPKSNTFMRTYMSFSRMWITTFTGHGQAWSSKIIYTFQIHDINYTLI